MSLPRGLAEQYNAYIKSQTTTCQDKAEKQVIVEPVKTPAPTPATPVDAAAETAEDTPVAAAAAPEKIAAPAPTLNPEPKSEPCPEPQVTALFAESVKNTLKAKNNKKGRRNASK